MLRGLLSIVAVIVIAASLLVMLPTIILPNTFLHQIVPVLAPLHQAIACNDGETIDYKTLTDADGAIDTHFLCVNASGIERNVDAALRRPGYIGVGTLCLGGLLLLGPFLFAMRQTMSGAYGAESQTALRMGLEQTRRGFAELKESGVMGTTGIKTLPDDPDENS
jgi:hypothetical protein